MSVAGWLFQARMWREYAMAWDGHRTSTTGVGRDWVKCVLHAGQVQSKTITGNVQLIKPHVRL